MLTMPETVWRLAYETVSTGADVLVKATVLIVLAMLLNSLLRGQKRLLVRAAVWNALVAGLLVLPLTTLMCPRLRLACLPPLADAPAAGAESRSQPDSDPPAFESTVAESPVAVHASVEPTQPEALTPGLEIETPGPEEAGAVLRPETRRLAQEATTLFWPAGLLALYAFGVALLLVRLLCSLLAVSRLRRTATPVSDSAWTAALERWKKRLNFAARVELATSKAINVPLAFGWLRPTVVIPEALVSTLDAKQREVILVHELAHVSRRDYAWQLLLKLVQASYWVHPLVWLVGRRVSVIREQVCDDLCSYHAATPQDYRATLVAVATRLTRRPAISLGIAMARTTKIAGRLERIDNGHCLANCLAARPARALLAALAIVATAIVGPIELARRTVADDNPGLQAELEEEATALPHLSQPTVTLRVLDSDGKPVTRARVGTLVSRRANARASSWRFGGQSGTTDDEGRIVLSVDNLFAKSRSTATKVCPVFACDSAGELGGLIDIRREDAGSEKQVKLESLCTVKGELRAVTPANADRPVSWAMVQILHQDCPIAEYESTTEGFEIPLPPGEFQIHVRTRDTREVRQTLTVRSGELEKELAIEFPITRLASLYGQPAPEFRDIKAWRNVAPVNIADLRGNVVLLYFWRISTDREDPYITHLIKLHDSLAGRKGLVIIGVHDASVTSLQELNARIKKAKPYWLGRDLPFPVALDGGGERLIEGTDKKVWGSTRAAYGIESGPKIILIDAEGTIVGEYNQLTDEGEAKIAAMMPPEHLTDSPPASEQAAETATGGSSRAGWEERFNAVYRLEDNQVLKCIAPPFIPERLDYYRQREGFQARAIPSPPDYFRFRWNDGLQPDGYGFVGETRSLAQVLGILGLASYEYELSPEVKSVKLAGDWIVRDGTSHAERLKALAPILAQNLGRPITLDHQTLERDVVVARGQYAFRPLTGMGVYDNDSVHIFADKLDADERAGGGTANLDGFLSWVGDLLSRPVINEAEAAFDTRIVYANHNSGYLRKMPDGPEKAAKLQQVLSNVARQTSLQLVSDRRRIEVWSIAAGSAAPLPAQDAPKADGVPSKRPQTATAAAPSTAPAGIDELLRLLERRADELGPQSELARLTAESEVLTRQVAALEAEKLKQKSVYENLKDLRPEQVPLSPEMQQLIQQHTGMVELRNELTSLKEKRRALTREDKPNSSAVANLDASIAEVKREQDELTAKLKAELIAYQLKSAEQAYLNATEAELQLRERLEEQEAIVADARQRSRSSIYLMMGDAISRPGPYALQPDQETTLLQAVAAAGGISKGSTDDRIRIFRGPSKGRIIVDFKLNSILAGKSHDPVLRPGDVIYVGAPPAEGPATDEGHRAGRQPPAAAAPATAPAGAKQSSTRPAAGNVPSTLEELFARMTEADQAMQTFAATSRTSTRFWQKESSALEKEPSGSVVNEQVVSGERFRIKKATRQSFKKIEEPYTEEAYYVFDGQAFTVWNPKTEYTRREATPRLPHGMIDPRQIGYWDSNGESRIDALREQARAGNLRMSLPAADSDQTTIVLETSGGPARKKYKIYIEPTRGFLPSRVEEYVLGQLYCIIGDIVHRRMPNGTWFPVAAKLQNFERFDPERAGELAYETAWEIDLKSLTVSPEITAATFKLQLPAGTQVHDSVLDKRYVIGQRSEPGRDPTMSAPAELTEEEQKFDAAWQERFDKVYRLDDTQVLKRIAPPWIPERLRCYQEKHRSQAELIPLGPSYWYFNWNGTLHDQGMGFNSKTNLHDVMAIVGLHSYEVSGPKELFQLQLPGDWIVRTKTSRQARLDALETIIREATNRRVRFTHRTVERPVIVVRGEYQFQPHPQVKDDRGSIHIFAQSTEGGGGGSGNLDQFLAWVGEDISRQLVNEVKNPPREKISWRDHQGYGFTCNLPEGEREEKIKLILANLTAQTSLEFVPEQRQVEVWFVSEDEAVSSSQPE